MRAALVDAAVVGTVAAVPGLATINGIACASATACVAVGPSLGDTAAVSIERTTDEGTSRASATVPSGLYEPGTQSVACPSSVTCVAVG